MSFLDHLQKLTKAISLSPWSKIPSVRQKVFSASLAIFTATLATYLLLAKRMNTIDTPAVLLITRFRVIAHTLVNLNALISATILHPEEFGKLLELVENTARLFGKNDPRPEVVLTTFATFSVVIFLTNVLDWSVCTYLFGVRSTRYFLFKPAQSLHFFINFFFISALVYLILTRFRTFRRSLEENLRGFKVSKNLNYCKESLRVCKDLNGFYLRDILEITANFRFLCEILEIFNRIFGWNIFLAMVYFTCDLLNTVYLVFLMGQNKFGITGFEKQVFLVMLFQWSFVFVIFEVILANLCWKIKLEMRNVSRICYEFLSTSAADGSTVNRELSLVIQQIRVRAPGVSAAGFCDVDHTLIFNLFNMVVSYLVILIQITK